MAENGNGNNSTESFVLGLVVAMILFLLFRKEFDKLAMRIENGSNGNRAGSTKSCGGACGGACGTDFAENPEISLGNQSYNSDGPFSASSVVN